MSIADSFRSFCENLTINNKDSISLRYQTITRRLNQDFWESNSSTAHSLYVGSYGRGTAIRGFSDLDMIFRLRYEYYQRYNRYQSNGQSAMLQDVRNSIGKTYTSTRIGADGQVVIISFIDGIIFEVVPAFLNTDDSYTYPDSNEGGRWRETNPKPEIEAISRINSQCNNNLKQLCRMARAWKNTWNVPMGGLLIDTLASRFIITWKNRDKSFLYYDYMSRDFFNYLSNEPERAYWQAVGSNQYIWSKGKFQYKAKQCYKLALEAIEYDVMGYPWSCRQKWRQVYGSAFPA